MSGVAVRMVMIALLMALAAAVSVARDDDDAPWETAPMDVTATLSLRFDKAGAVDADLNLPDAPASWEEIRSTLGRGLHCPGGRLDDQVGFDRTSTALPSAWTTAQRERYLAAMAKISQKQLAGTCVESLGRHEGVFEGDIDYGPLAEQLGKSGVQQLDLFVVLPPAEYRDYTKAGLSHQYGADRSLMYVISLDGTSSDHVVHLAYGFRAQRRFEGPGCGRGGPEIVLIR